MQTPKKSLVKIYTQYENYLDDESKNILSEPGELYATAFEDMVAVANYDKNFAADLLDVSYKTITRYQKEKKKFSPLQSEYILKTIALFNKGSRVFGSEESFSRWLDKPSFGLGNKIPRKLITTVSGINFVTDELNRIAHGDLS
jgi:putative toxin-antitoxin system antitoxin component (TIGR02293 family)